MGAALAQHAHMHMGHEETESPPALDNRTPLQLEPEIREVLLQTMRGHLEALEAIIAALAEGNFEVADRTAREKLGFAEHHRVMRREKRAAFPEGYQELAMAHHQAAEDLAAAIPSRDLKTILPELDRTVKACVACHQAYKL